ncbi:MAG: nucleoside deaminase [Opitutales bacterium]
MPRFPQLQFALPEWVEAFVPSPEEVFSRPEDRMRLVIELARRNVAECTGGPFGAAIFDLDRHTLIAPGINLVVASGYSWAHAEMVAFSIAQLVLGTHDLGDEGMPRCELVTSVEPCAMCFGATPWSGVRQVICGARDNDARAIGFDEGPKVDDWSAALESRGIKVLVDILQEEASQVLQDYAAKGGPIYNARGGG